ncbi:MAG TPA: 6-carboxytetrahydropterin synthase QueD [Deltaproteobacteria bacterium]|nr:6-carboxytetrahydropterin synthase QueD [Deltaproteobacteria bacterium]
MYEVIITQPFVAAHRLKLYGGEWEPLHGHNWKVEVRLAGRDLDRIEVLIDFLEVKKQVQNILKEIDYTYFNENERFSGHNPSAEIVARWIFGKVQAAISHPVARVQKVTVWETEDCAASYSEA